jgi:hypothetical protein
MEGTLPLMHRFAQIEQSAIEALLCCACRHSETGQRVCVGQMTDALMRADGLGRSAGQA